MATERINDLRAEETREEALEAIRRGLADFEAGRTVGAIEFVERMRRKIHGVAKSYRE